MTGFKNRDLSYISAMLCMGAESYVYTKCGNASITIRIEGTTNLKVGEKAKIYLDSNKLHVFDKDTTLRVI